MNIILQNIENENRLMVLQVKNGFGKKQIKMNVFYEELKGLKHGMFSRIPKETK